VAGHRALDVTMDVYVHASLDEKLPGVTGLRGPGGGPMIAPSTHSAPASLPRADASHAVRADGVAST